MKFIMACVLSAIIGMWFMGTVRTRRIHALEVRVDKLESDYLIMTKVMDSNFKFVGNAMKSHKDRIEGLIVDVVDLEGGN